MIPLYPGLAGGLARANPGSGPQRTVAIPSSQPDDLKRFHAMMAATTRQRSRDPLSRMLGRCTIARESRLTLAHRLCQEPWNLAHGFSRGKMDKQRKAPEGRRYMAHTLHGRHPPGPN